MIAFLVFLVSYAVSSFSEPSGEALISALQVTSVVLWLDLFLMLVISLVYSFIVFFPLGKSVDPSTKFLLLGFAFLDLAIRALTVLVVMIGIGGFAPFVCLLAWIFLELILITINTYKSVYKVDYPRFL